MAPNLAVSQRNPIRDMIQCKSLNDAKRAAIAGCSTRTIRAIRANLRCFGSTTAPPNGVGRPRTITPPMLTALCDRLIERPHMYQDEMIVFLWDEFDVLVTAHSISRALASAGWSKKTARRVALERNPDLRDFYLYNLSAFRSYHLVYIDESGCDKLPGFRRTGWSPSGVTPVQVSRFHRDQRHCYKPTGDGEAPPMDKNGTMRGYPDAWTRSFGSRD